MSIDDWCSRLLLGTERPRSAHCVLSVCMYSETPVLMPDRVDCVLRFD